VVKNVLERVTAEGQKYHLIYVDYLRSSGNAIDEWEEEVADYLEENGIVLDEDGDEEYFDDDLGDEDYDVFQEQINELMNDEEVEFMEYPDMICLNSLYYVFYK
jgi:hypothetical protein